MKVFDIFHEGHIIILFNKVSLPTNQSTVSCYLFSVNHFANFLSKQNACFFILGFFVEDHQDEDILELFQ